MKKVLLIVFSFLVISGLITTTILVDGAYHEVAADKVETADVVISGIQLDNEDSSYYSDMRFEGLAPSEHLQELDQFAWNAQSGQWTSLWPYWTIEIVYHQKDGKDLIRKYHGDEESPAGKKYFATLYLKVQELYMAEKDKLVEDDWEDDWSDDRIDNWEDDWSDDWN